MCMSVEASTADIKKFKCLFQKPVASQFTHDRLKCFGKFITIGKDHLEEGGVAKSFSQLDTNVCQSHVNFPFLCSKFEGIYLLYHPIGAIFLVALKQNPSTIPFSKFFLVGP